MMTIPYLNERRQLVSKANKDKNTFENLKKQSFHVGVFGKMKFKLRSTAFVETIATILWFEFELPK